MESIIIRVVAQPKPGCFDRIVLGDPQEGQHLLDFATVTVIR
jgi:hypothetical protein